MIHLINYAINFIYPPSCLYCDSHLIDNKLLFCAGCSAFFELIDPLSRCPYCFADYEGRVACRECMRKKRYFIKMASALDYLGAVCALVKGIKYGRMPYLAKTAGAFMIAQFFRLKWPIPDLIIPVPRREWFQGANHAQLLASNIATRLRTKSLPLIKRRAGDFSQARLTKQQRENLFPQSFYIKDSTPVENKIVLLIDDVITTGTTLRHCAESLASGSPKQIFALSLARTIHSA